MIDFIIKYWLQIILTLITTGIAYVFKQYISIRYGIQAILRNEIVRIYEEYTKLGYCPSFMKENVEEIYASYHNLKGDGLATLMVEEIYKLPLAAKLETNIKSKEVKMNG